jgi:hypothetical protein
MDINEIEIEEDSIEKTSDYFYDWQGYSPDDGSLDDGVVNAEADYDNTLISLQSLLHS